ncbi:dATP/dGTP diphosphohydrolase domain-containing protein
MSEFKKGDIVQCIDVSGGVRDLTLHKSYVVAANCRFSAEHGEDRVMITDDSGGAYRFKPSRFVLMARPDPLEDLPQYPAPASGYPDGNPKTAIGLTKPSFSNVPSPALLPMMAAFADGAKKYGRFNWREKGVTASVYYDAAQRHLQAYWDGEDAASDSKVHHLGHAMACLAIILDAGRHGKLNDDRNGSGEFSKMVAEMTTAVGA